MQFEDYQVGVVVSHCGANAHQLAEVNRRIAFIAGLLGPEGKINLVIPGFSQVQPEAEIPSHIKNLMYRTGVGSIKYLACSSKGSVSADLFNHLLSCDEVWCIAASGQTTTGSRARVSKIYRMGIADAIYSRIFKLIPAWTPAQEAVTTKVKKMKGKRK